MIYRRWSGAAKRLCAVALLLVGTGMWAQAQSGNPAQPSPQKPSTRSQSGGAPNPTSSSAPAQQDANPFPTDTTNVPVMPSANSPGSFPANASANDARTIAMPSDDADPVRSPDDPGAAEVTGAETGSSDSQAGLDQLLQPPPDTGRHRGKGDDNIDAPYPHDGPKKNIDIGNFYLDSGDWKGALSRFESALVEDPENPDVYWGLAEAQRHMGLYAKAKANYMKVAEYDPDSRHGKDARKLLKQPELANAPAVPTPAAKTP